MIAAEKTATVDIRVKTPLPSSVVLTLGRLIDAVWPGTELADSEGGREVVFRIDPAARQNVADTEAQELVIEPDGEDPDIFTLGPDGVSMANPADLAAALLPVIEQSFAENPEAVNYLETKVTNPETRNTYVIFFARSQGQTPHELRMKAEENLENARAEAERENTAAVQRLLSSPRGTREDSYRAGVQAALEAMRAVNYGRTQIDISDD